MKLLFLFNEFFLYHKAFHGNLNFLEQTCTFLHLLTQLSSLSYVCFICRGIFNFAAAFFILPWLFCFAVNVFSFFFLPWLFYFCRDFFVLPWLFYFAMAFLFCRDFFIFPWLFCFAVTFLFCRGCFVLLWLFYFWSWLFLFCRGFFVLPWHLWAAIEKRFGGP